MVDAATNLSLNDIAVREHAKLVRENLRLALQGEVARCDRLGVEPGIEWLKLVTELRKAEKEQAEEAEKGAA